AIPRSASCRGWHWRQAGTEQASSAPSRPLFPAGGKAPAHRQSARAGQRFPPPLQRNTASRPTRISRMKHYLPPSLQQWFEPINTVVAILLILLVAWLLRRLTRRLLARLGRH